MVGKKSLFKFSMLVLVAVVNDFYPKRDKEIMLLNSKTQANDPVHRWAPKLLI